MSQEIMGSLKDLERPEFTFYWRRVSLIRQTSGQSDEKYQKVRSQEWCKEWIENCTYVNLCQAREGSKAVLIKCQMTTSLRGGRLWKHQNKNLVQFQVRLAGPFLLLFS